MHNPRCFSLIGNCAEQEQLLMKKALAPESDGGMAATAMSCGRMTVMKQQRQQGQHDNRNCSENSLKIQKIT